MRKSVLKRIFAGILSVALIGCTVPLFAEEYYDDEYYYYDDFDDDYYGEPGAQEPVDQAGPAFKASIKDVSIKIGGEEVTNGSRVNLVLSENMNDITFSGKGYKNNVKAVKGAERLVEKYWVQAGSNSAHTTWKIGSSRAVKNGTKFKISIYLVRQRYNGVSWVTIGEDVVTFTLVAVDTVPVKKTAPVLTNVYNSKSGADIRWKKVKGAAGYIVYRNRSGEGTTKVATIENVNTLKCYDTTIKNNCYGRVYSYYVKALYEENGKIVTGPSSNKIVFQRLAPMKITSASNNAAGKIRLNWKCTAGNNKAKGYEIQYATSSGDLSGRRGSFKKVTVKGRDNLKVTLVKLTKGKTYWIRVRGYGIYTNPTTGKQTKTWSQYSNTVKVKIKK